MVERVPCSCGNESCTKTVTVEPLCDGRNALLLRKGDGLIVSGIILDRDGMTALNKRLGEILGGSV